MFQSLRNHSECQGLHVGHCVIAALPVAHDAREIWHLGNPPAVRFVFDLDREDHVGTVTSEPAA